MNYIPTFEDKSEHYAALIEKGHEFALQFNALCSFSSVKYICPVMSARGGSVALSLYKYDGGYEKTLLGKPLATCRCDLKDGTDMYFNFESMPAGEYLLLAHDGTAGAGFCGLIDSFDAAQLYMNGVPCDGSMEAYIGFNCEADEYFSAELTFDPKAAKKPEKPHQEMLSSTHPINSLNVNNHQWSAYDGLGRRLPEFKDVGSKRKNKSVGVFFWDWHYHFEHDIPVNVNDLTEFHPEIKNDFNHPIWKDHQADGNHWNEPLWGYYTSTDKYVLKKQAQMLADADVDFIVFDCTNGTYTWKVGYETLMETFEEARADGIKTPQIVFMLNFAPFRSSWVMLRQIYTDVYRKGRYKDLWYYLDGKPLIIAHNDCHMTGRKLDNEILDFFTFRKNDPLYFTKEPTADNNWGWLSVNPQARYGLREDGSCEQITVGVAHNASVHGLVPMNDIRGGVFGRCHTTDPDYSYKFDRFGETVTVNASTENAVNYGLNFQEQWDYAIKVDPDVVFVTGWNEWVAGRHEMWMDSPNAFPDQFNNEFSRDIEPTKGALSDHYYMQLISNIRRYKGIRSDSDSIIKKSVDINNPVAFDDVEPENHYRNTTIRRDNKGWAGCHYNNDSMRNEIVVTKTVYDEENIYFYAECTDSITDPDNKWMRLFIACNENDAGWEGFNYVVNRNAADSASVIERSLGGWNWETVGNVDISKHANKLMIKIPRAMITQNESISLSYKWADNNCENGDILSFYTDGCAAPGGRFAVKIHD